MRAEMGVRWSLGSGVEDRCVIVTGAAGGIGRSVAIAFAAVGARVVLVDVNESVTAVAQSLSGTGHSSCVVDISDTSTHDMLVRSAESLVGPVYALVNVAAVLRRMSLDSVTVEDWDVQLNTNLRSTFFLCRAVAQSMIIQGEGRIVNFASQGWWTGGSGASIPYAASKGGLVSMTRGLARALGPHQTPSTQSLLVPSARRC